jgi:acyl carrier protein
MDKRTKIKTILGQIAENPIDPAPDESLFESGLLDSFTIADLMAALETEFHIRIPDSDRRPRKFDTIELIEAYVNSRS